MATLTFSFDTGNVPISRIVDAMAIKYGYQATIPDPENAGGMIPNPETKAQFGRRQIRNIIVSAVKEAEVLAAREVAESSVTEVTLT